MEGHGETYLLEPALATRRLGLVRQIPRGCVAGWKEGTWDMDNDFYFWLLKTYVPEGCHLSRKIQWCTTLDKVTAVGLFGEQGFPYRVE